MQAFDEAWMRQALALAHRAKEAGEVPVGALLIGPDQQILGQGWNQVEQTHDPCAHAEIIAIREAARNHQKTRLLDCTLYVTLEPCCMCAGALVHARVKRLVFAARDFRAGAAGSAFQLLNGDPLNHRVWVDEGVLHTESTQLLQDFFKTLR